MPDVRLQTIESEDDPAASLRDPLEAGCVGQREGEQFVVAVEQIAHRTWSHGHPTVEQVCMDVRQTAVLRRVKDPRRKRRGF
jgi:hypothetical protein